MRESKGLDEGSVLLLPGYQPTQKGGLVGTSRVLPVDALRTTHRRFNV